MSSSLVGRPGFWNFSLKGHKKVVKEILVENVYMYKESCLVERPDALPINRPNCMSFQDVGLFFFIDLLATNISFVL